MLDTIFDEARCSHQNSTDVSAGKWVAWMISPPRQHTSCFSDKISACSAIASFSVLACGGLRSTRVTRGFGTCRKSKLVLCSFARPGPWQLFCICGSSCKKRPTFLVGNVDSRDLHRTARECAGKGGRCSFFRRKASSSKGYRITLRVLLFT